MVACVSLGKIMLGPGTGVWDGKVSSAGDSMPGWKWAVSEVGN